MFCDTSCTRFASVKVYTRSLEDRWAFRVQEWIMRSYPPPSLKEGHEDEREIARANSFSRNAASSSSRNARKCPPLIARCFTRAKVPPHARENLLAIRQINRERDLEIARNRLYVPIRPVPRVEWSVYFPCGVVPGRGCRSYLQRRRRFS